MALLIRIYLHYYIYIIMHTIVPTSFQYYNVSSSGCSSLARYKNSAFSPRDECIYNIAKRDESPYQVSKPTYVRILFVQ